MPYRDDAPDRPDPILAAARIGELTRLALWLEQPGLTLDDVRRYVADRLERLYPIDFHVYRQRWQALADGARPGPLLTFLEWWPLAQELAERAVVAEMVGEVDGRIDGLRRVLLAEEEHTAQRAHQDTHGAPKPVWSPSIAGGRRVHHHVPLEVDSA